MQAVLVALAAAAGVAAGVWVMTLDLHSTAAAVTRAWVFYASFLSAGAALTLRLRPPHREHALWTIGGLLFGFTILGGFSIGPAFLPAAGLLLLGAFVGDVRSPRWLLLHVPLALVAGLLQIAVPLIVMRGLYR